MPNDVLTLNAQALELHATLQRGRIDRITQPEKDEVFFTVRAGGRNHVLVISANPNAPRIHLTRTKKDNPYAAPAFLMHLRRHLLGGTVEHVRLVGDDRIIEFAISARNDLSDTVSYRLYVELMGRYSNLILTDSTGHITDALRHIAPDPNQLRAVLPKLRYQLPPQSKIPLTSSDKTHALLDFTGGDLAKYIVSTLGGLATSTAFELLFRAGLSERTTPVGEEEAERLSALIDEAYLGPNGSLFAPCHSVSATGAPEDYFLFPYTYSGRPTQPTDSIGEAVRLCAEAKDRATRLSAGAKLITTALKAAVKKHTRGLAAAEQKLLECAEADTLKLYGELITANLYRLTKGMTSATLYDYYEDCDRTVPLDVRLSPAENAQAYYKRYAKQKRTVAISKEQILTHRAELEYLASVSAALSLATEPKDLLAIEQELSEGGYLKKQGKSDKKRQESPLAPLQFAYKSAIIFCGRNNLQNDNLTFRLSREGDIWCHVHDAHGAHVLLRGSDSPDAIRTACEIAAYYSNLKQSGKALVDYCSVRHVHRHPSRKPGMVTYTHYNGADVTPMAHTELQKEETNGN